MFLGINLFKDSYNPNAIDIQTNISVMAVKIATNFEKILIPNTCLTITYSPPLVLTAEEILNNLIQSGNDKPHNLTDNQVYCFLNFDVKPITCKYSGTNNITNSC